MSDVVMSLLKKGWVFESMGDSYAIVPCDERRGWAAEWVPHDFRGIKIYVPSWYLNK